jgi:hypothetical protein
MTDRREGTARLASAAEALPPAGRLPAPAGAGSAASSSAPSRLAWAARGLARAGWAPAGLFLLHLVLVQATGLYARHSWLDIPMHVAGGVAISFFILACWRAAVVQGAAGRPARAVTPLVVWLGTCGAAIVWEFGEFGSDRLLGTRVQTSVEDTLADMLFGLLGGLVVAAVSWRRTADPAAAAGDTTNPLLNQ